MKVQYKTKAIRQLRAIEFYLASHNPGAAARVMQRIDRAIQNLVNHPYSHRKGALAGSRELVFGEIPYIVVYRVSEHSIDILGVFYAARHPSVRTRP